MDDLTAARWYRLRSHPSIVEAWPADRESAEPEPFLVGEVDAKTPYDALAAGDSALFLTFQSRVHDADSALTFASEFGFLGAPITERVRLPDSSKQAAVEAMFVVGDSLGAWLGEADALRRAVALWGAIRRNDRRAMLDDPHVAAISRPLNTLSQSAPLHLSAVPDPEVRRHALFTLQILVNRGLQAPIDRYEARVGAELRIEGDGLAFRVIGRTLLGDMWLQLALAVGGDKRFRHCPQDARWWELHPDIARTNKVYCSDACKQAAYRERKARRAKA